MGQSGEPLGLAADVCEPLVLAALHFSQVRVGADDGQGRFQLVAGVGDKALLLFVALGHRTDDPLGEEEQQHQHRAQTQERQGDTI